MALMPHVKHINKSRVVNFDQTQILSPVFVNEESLKKAGMHLIYFNKYQNKKIGKSYFGSQISVEAKKKKYKKTKQTKTITTKEASLKAYTRMNNLLLLKTKFAPLKILSLFQID